MSKFTTAQWIEISNNENGQDVGPSDLWCEVVEFVGLVWGEGREILAQLDHERAEDSILLAEALNFAAKKYYIGYELKEAFVEEAAWKVLAQGGKAGYEEDEDGYDVFSLWMERVGTVGFHRVIVGGVGRFGKDWSGHRRQHEAFDLIRSWFGDRELIREYAEKTHYDQLPSPRYWAYLRDMAEGFLEDAQGLVEGDLPSAAVASLIHQRASVLMACHPQIESMISAWTTPEMIYQAITWARENTEWQRRLRSVQAEAERIVREGAIPQPGGSRWARARHHVASIPRPEKSRRFQGIEAASGEVINEATFVSRRFQGLMD